MHTWQGLSLFSGIGGLDLAFEWAGGKVSAMCEIGGKKPFCRKVLRKHWPNVPLFEDVREMKGADVGAALTHYLRRVSVSAIQRGGKQKREGRLPLHVAGIFTLGRRN